MKTIKSSFTVKMATSAEERAEVFRIRYEVYIEEMGWSSKYADHATRMIHEPLDETGILWIAVVGGRIVGSLRGNISACSDLGHYKDLYRLRALPEYPSGVGILTNFVIHREHRDLSVALALVRAAYAEGEQRGVVSAFLDCEPRMVRLYAWLGFKVHVPIIDHPEYGRGVCMRMDIHEWTQRFAKVQSEAA